MTLEFRLHMQQLVCTNMEPLESNVRLKKDLTKGKVIRHRLSMKLDKCYHTKQILSPYIKYCIHFWTFT